MSDKATRKQPVRQWALRAASGGYWTPNAHWTKADMRRTVLPGERVVRVEIREVTK